MVLYLAVTLTAEKSLRNYLVTKSKSSEINYRHQCDKDIIFCGGFVQPEPLFFMLDTIDSAYKIDFPDNQINYKSY